MASLNRISKSGSDWNLYDLNAYNIQIQHDDRATFFGNSKLPLPIIDEELLTTLKAEDMLSDHNAELIHLLDLAMSPASARQSAVNDFTVGLLRQLGYVKHNRIACTQMNIPSVVAREWRDTINDICLLDDPPYWHILLLIQEVKHFQPDDQYDPSASLIAKAIGAFDYNNRNLVQMQWGKPTITSKVCGFYNFATFTLLTCNVGHARHHHEWNNAHFLQDPCHSQPCVQCIAGHIPIRTYYCFSLCSRSSQPSMPFREGQGF
jgi:hypothetical protein